ncbi:insulinoma-associated protein 1-like [Cotesia glomerata]|uniref:insulinoma-associated protein 1-like n=1 Tax=Cotesia glomerata TaxID=32391 RepID=UPI001D0188DF|nr:insulinoma-associated protein 1-like [Cotesia glomerata]
MLHSALPRSFLAPPGLCYLGGYYGETVHPYSPVSRFASLENSYLPEHLAVENPVARPSLPASPSPLDLSLKPPAPQTPATDDSETIEVDDVEDRPYPSSEDSYEQLREKRFHDWERFAVDDQQQQQQQQQQQRAYQFYDELRARPTSQDPVYSEIYQSPSSSPSPSQKLLLTSPNTLRSMQTYQQQLLLTPQHHLQGVHAPMTPPSTPSPPQCPRRRPREDPSGSITTPKSSTSTSSEKISRPKKKHARRLKFDEDTSSPVSGTVILGPDEAVVTGDIDPAFNVVEVTEEARAELAKIENRLGPYQCKLCRHLHEDAFQLAQHRCSRIAHVEYRCPECDKRFSCPANLASHRRWHKPRAPVGDHGSAVSGAGNSAVQEIGCNKCDAKFTKQSALRKHFAAQHPDNNNVLIVNNRNSNSIDNGSNGNFGNNIVSSSNSNSSSSSSSNENVCMETGTALASKSLAVMQLASGPLSNEMP